MSKIAFLGDKYTHTYAAATKLTNSGDVLVGYNTIYDSIKAVVDGKCAYAVAPIENSCGGSITDTLDALRNWQISICAETVIAVPQNLIGLNGAVKSDIKTIYSHPQAISQSIEYLRANFIPADVIAVKSTAQALGMITDKSIAAIARKPAEGQHVIEADIEDVKNNSTRFVMLSGETCLIGDKCSIFFETKDTPGALADVLDVLKKYDLNMTKIESLPQKSRLGRYVFFIDFIAGFDKPTLANILTAIAAQTSEFKFLGQYPVK